MLFSQSYGYGCLLLGKGAVEQPDDDRQVLALIVSGQDHRVLVAFGCHCVEGLLEAIVEGWNSNGVC